MDEWYIDSSVGLFNKLKSILMLLIFVNLINAFGPTEDTVCTTITKKVPEFTPISLAYENNGLN